MVEINGKDIAISQGESTTFTMYFSDDIPEEGTKAVFTVKTSTRDKVPMIEKTAPVTNGKVFISLTTADTDRPCGKYQWDIQLKYLNGDVTIPMDPAPFTIKEVVGHA